MPGVWVQVVRLGPPPQVLSFTCVPLAVPATRIFTMAVISSRCFLSSSSSTWEAGRGRDRWSLLCRRHSPALHPHRLGTHIKHHHIVVDEVFHHMASLVVLPICLEERGPKHDSQVVCVHLVRVGEALDTGQGRTEALSEESGLPHLPNS